MPALEKQTTLLHAHDKAREAVVMEVKEAAGAQSLTAASAALNEQARKVFVSPRVVDERSFEQLASTLRALTTEAANQGKSLAQASEGVRSLSENLRGLTKDLATKTDQATKVMPVLETRVASAQQLIDRVTRDTAIVKAREARDAISAQIAEQSATWKQQFVQEARESVMSQATAAVDEVMAQHAQSMIASKVQAAVDAAIEAAVRQAVRDAGCSHAGAVSAASARGGERWTELNRSGIASRGIAARGRGASGGGFELTRSSIEQSTGDGHAA
jgi:hypothetical protein